MGETSTSAQMIRGSLFTRYFLEEGVRAMDAYRQQDESTIAVFADAVRKRWRKLERMRHPSEAETEAEFIVPIMELLGWHHLPQQEPGRGRRDIADALFFTSAEAKDRARPLPSADRFRHGAVVAEYEARDTRLDRASGAHEAPSTQILRYLGRAEAQSGGVVRWGLLTNGHLWRLYWAQARARAEGFVEFDLPALVGELPPSTPEGADSSHWLRVFVLLFGRDAFIPSGAEDRTVLDLAVAEGRNYEQRVTNKLSGIVFNHVFPQLVAALGNNARAAKSHDTAWRAEIREAALVILYRLLFLLYAEDRDLLPHRNEAYRPYALRAMRQEAAEIVDGRRSVSEARKTWWPRLRDLFAAIAEGDASMGLPPYNGGLFDDGRTPILKALSLPDGILARIIDALSREEMDGGRRWINYRDLSVQHLGGIYEHLLEQEISADGGDGLVLRPSIFARKTSGSYYTPEELVALIIRRSIGPLLDERRNKFAGMAEDLAGDRRPKAERLKLLEACDPAEAFVSLRVCDPAMGSGHFLVSLVDYLADRALEAIGDAPHAAPWADESHPYRSPLVARIEALRIHIRETATAKGWAVPDEQLDDRHLVRRIILKRVIYGVDVNPMAVELAKLSLWLHSFTVGAPLSFLDHHLRCGDSLFGEFVRSVEDIAAEQAAMFLSPIVAQARNSAKGMAIVEQLTDSDLAEVKKSASTFHGVEEATAPLARFMDFIHGARWFSPLPKEDERVKLAVLSGTLGDPIDILSGKINPHGRSGVATAATALLKRVRDFNAERRFMHWEVAFPGVWDRWENLEPEGGFDAVIGNPPWDRMKLQEVEWFAARVPRIAHAQRAAERKRMIAELQRRHEPIAADYDRAAWTAEAAARVARINGAYPLLSGGDVNLYSLFVERAMRLVRKDGIIGLLVPSGIAADKGASEFFRSISTTGRLAALFDFENRRNSLDLAPFFPDVDSRFKFCAFIAGGPQRRFSQADCAFFQQDADAAEAAAFPLTPEDFSAVNPNTGTAPVFRCPRDAEITRAIYRRLPVLVDRRGEKPKSVWPVRYVRMFDMTNDSSKFRTAAELEKLGAYRVAGQRWEKGKQSWLPLMTGRMINVFDHRAASVVENPASLHNPFSSELTTLPQHADPAYTPAPQFWVSEAETEWPVGLDWGLAFRDIARPTDVRTVIAALVPRAGFANTLPLLLPDGDAKPYFPFAPLLLANLNTLALDYVARQKVQGTHLNFYIVEQLPVVPADGFSRRFGKKTADQIIREDVLHLTYVSRDMAAFARDQGYDGPAFPWDEEDRLRRRARLDAVFFHLYGLDREAAEYVLGTFPIVRREEEQRYGHFRSRDLILGFMAALAAGSPGAAVAG